MQSLVRLQLLIVHLFFLILLIAIKNLKFRISVVDDVFVVSIVFQSMFDLFNFFSFRKHNSSK